MGIRSTLILTIGFTILALCNAAPNRNHERYKRQIGFENFTRFFQATWESFKRDIWEPTKREHIAPAFDAYVKPIINNVVKEGHEQWMNLGNTMITAANEAMDRPGAPVTVGGPINENALLAPGPRSPGGLAQQPDVIVLDELPARRQQP